MFLRISRMPVPAVHLASETFTLGKAALLNQGDDVTIITNGVLVYRALLAAQALETKGIYARVLNMSSIKPIDSDAIVNAARTTQGIVTAEEALLAGGLGSAVAEILALHHPAPMRMLGVPDVFAPTGSSEFLLEHFQLTEQGIMAAALELLDKKNL